MESPREHVEGIVEAAQDYTNKTIELTKLKAVDKVSRVTGTLAVEFVTLTLLTLFMFMLSIGCAFIIGEALGAAWIGFMIMAGLYGLLAFILRAWLAKRIRSRIGDIVIDAMLN